MTTPIADPGGGMGGSGSGGSGGRYSRTMLTGIRVEKRFIRVPKPWATGDPFCLENEADCCDPPVNPPGGSDPRTGGSAGVIPTTPCLTARCPGKVWPITLWLQVLNGLGEEHPCAGPTFPLIWQYTNPDLSYGEWWGYDIEGQRWRFWCTDVGFVLERDNYGHTGYAGFHYGDCEPFFASSGYWIPFCGSISWFVTE